MGYFTFGGNLSVRKPPDMKPLMIFGQDESVYRQFLLGNRQWVGPQGQHPLLPKTDGLTLMVSALQSRETGKTLQELKIELVALNVLSVRWQYRLAELQEIARNNNIDPKIEKTSVKKGWEGQPIGLLQVLWERG